MNAPERWWGRWWIPRRDFDEKGRQLHEALLERNVARQKATDSEERLAKHMEASKFVAARGDVSYDFAHGVIGARRLRLEILVDDRVLYNAVDTNAVRDAVAREAAYKAKQAILSLDFALARAVMPKTWKP